MWRVGALSVAVSMCLASAAPASPIGDAHRAINASYRSQDDGYAQGRITGCRRVTRRIVDCTVRLTNPLRPLTCQPGTLLIVPAGLGPCETPPASIEVTVRVYRGRVIARAVVG